MSQKDREPTWLDLAVANAGLRKAIVAIQWAHSWCVVQASLGRDPTVEEVADWWKMSRRTAFRDQSIFREAFPMLENPSPLYATEPAQETLQGFLRMDEKLMAQASKIKRLRESAAVVMGRIPARVAGRAVGKENGN